MILFYSEFWDEEVSERYVILLSETTIFHNLFYRKVFLAELNGYDIYFAIKCLKKHSVIEDDDIESIMIERKVLAYGSAHPFICKLFCTFQTPVRFILIERKAFNCNIDSFYPKSYLCFAMEWCCGGDLMFHVQKNGKFDEDKARSVLILKSLS